MNIYKQLEDEIKKIRKEKNKECNTQYIRKYRIKNSKKAKEYQKQWYIDYRKEHEQYYLDKKKKNGPSQSENMKKILEMRRQCNIDDKEKIREYTNEYYRQYNIENREKVRRIQRVYHMENFEEISDRRKKRSKIRYKTDLKFNINSRMGGMVWHSLKAKGVKAGRKWEILVDYNINDLIKRLKKTMPKGYTWKDFLKGKLEIDHIIPVDVFNFDKTEHTDFKRCWALSNLRLLTKRENRIKSNKLNKPFQPALRI
ncbi:hypothetical protein ES708_31848 [subsurface metagenome]